VPIPLPYRIGCPVWACGEWRGTLFPEKAPRTSWLRHYSAVFGTVEGNSTFYTLPSVETARRWADEAADGFRFALKFPRAITHEAELVDCDAVTGRFLEILAALHERDRLGPSFLQLGPAFDGRRFDALARYLRSLPSEFPWAVEVRHADWFDEGRFENALNQLLREVGMDRALFDSRALFSRPPSDEWEVESCRRKPRSPLRRTVTGPRPMLRLVGRNRIEEADPWLTEWAGPVAEWIRAGHEPYVFLHAPNDRHAPELAARFHEALRRHLPELPDLVIRPPANTPHEPSPVQQTLF
jgi:uncharacterized protein YecE (DUF72 family)